MKEWKILSDDLLGRIKIFRETLPTVMDYRELLSAAHLITGETYDHLRDKYGMYTYAQWGDLFNRL